MKTFAVESSNIKSIGYDPTTKELIVTFKNDTSYSYPNMNPAIVCNLLFADSVGKKFHDTIKIHKATKI